MSGNLARGLSHVSTPGHMPALDARHRNIAVGELDRREVLGAYTRGEYRIHERLLDAKSDYRAMSRFAALGWGLLLCCLGVIGLLWPN